MLRLLNRVRPYAFIQLVLAITIILVSLFGPIKFTSTEYSFNSSTNGNNLSINLLEPVPKKIDLSIKHKSNKNFTDRIEVKTSAESERLRSLKLVIEETNLTLEVTQTKFKEAINLYSPIENIRIIFDQSQKNIVVKINGATQSDFTLDPDEFPFVSGIHILSNSNNYEVTGEITTLANTRNNTISKYLSFAVLLVLTLSLTKKNFLNVNTRNIKLRPKYSDLIVAILLVFMGVLAAPGNDDGEILTMQRTFANFGFASSYSNAYPLGQWWFWINSYWANLFDQIFLLRMPNLFIYFVTWVILDRFIEKNFGNQDYYKHIQKINLVTYSVFVVAWSGSLRYDAMSVLILTILIILLHKIKNESNNYVYLVGFIWFYALALTLSLSGWVVTFLALPFLYFFLLKNKAFSYPTIILLTYFVAVFSTLMFYKSNIWLLFGDIRNFTQGGTTHSFFGFGEILRYQSIFAFWGSAARWSVFLALITLIFTVFVAKKIIKSRDDQQSRFILLVATLAIPGLFLTTSKYGWHFQAYLPIVLLLNSITLKYLNKLKSYAVVVFLFIPTFHFAILGSNTFKYTEESTFRINGPIDYFSNTNINLYGDDSNIFLSTAFIIIGYLVLSLLFKKNNIFMHFVYTGVLSLALVLPTMLYPLFDAVRATNWQFNKQVAFGIVDESWQCGIPSKTLTINQVKMFDLNKEEEVKVGDISYFSKPYYYETKDLVNGSMSFPLKEKNTTILIWVSGVTTPQDGRVLVEIRNDKGTVDEEQSLQANDLISVGDYQLYEFTPTATGELVVKIEPKVGTSWERFRFFVGKNPKFSNAINYENSNKAWVNTFRTNLLFFPCQKSNKVQNGVKPIPEYQFGLTTNMARDAVINSEADLLPVYCLEMKNENAIGANCFYKLIMKGIYDWDSKNIETYSKGWKIFI